jgi:ABC-type glycerol-3-phosphate transport system permease component
MGWEYIGGTIFNTAFVAGSVTLLSLILAIGGAYFFARFRLPGSDFLFFLFIALMTYPTVANMVPMFSLLSELGLFNTHLALILPAVAGAQAFNIFVLRNFIAEIPQDLFDAAEVDGATIWQQLRYIVLPHTMPAIGALGILLLLTQWNSFVAPLLYLRDDELQLLSVALMRLEGEYTKNGGGLMAGYVIASLPLIILSFFCMELFIKGLSSNGNFKRGNTADF